MAIAFVMKYSVDEGNQSGGTETGSSSADGASIGIAVEDYLEKDLERLNTEQKVASQAVTATGKTFQQTSGGSIEPYQAAALSMPDCRNLPSLSNVTDALQRYLFRVGSDTQCLNSADITVLCNAPLLNNTAYRFKYLLVGVNGSSKHVLAQTPWSDAIFTKQIKAFEAIDTWPGKMTGGQVVVTTILIVLLFVLLCACVATLVFSIWGNGLPKMESTRHASQITQQVQLSATTETAASGATADEKAISYASQHP
ncbi:uroplakin-3a [Protopterus annectens]|uniref:uroplakin-3a n=1 Tax=Protopterus annectens TaxID=7888 RepID=UPI001CF96A94|nr:uroplakin-3a [Protopterus annectens]